jgi:hypothetical protein
LHWNGIVEKIKPTFEVLSFATNIGLFATVIIGIKQLRLVKEDNKNRDERSAKEKSIEQLRWLNSEFIPKFNEFVEKAKKADMPLYNGEINKDFTIDEYDKKTLDLIDFLLTNKAVDLLNNLEYFSLALISGIADKSILNGPIIQPYTLAVINFYPVICWVRTSDSKAFDEVIELFWDLVPYMDERENEVKFTDKGTVIIKETGFEKIHSI